MAVIELAQTQATDETFSGEMALITNRLAHAKDYWKPLHARMDYWASMYYMQDIIQMMKPVNHRRFISNEPHTAVDLGVSILTRNDAYWRIALFESMSENAEQRRFIGKVERALQGAVNDIDETFSMRGRMPFWKQAAAQALLRGWIWGKIHVTTDALQFKSTPIVCEMYDPRLVFPHFDAYGLSHVCIESLTTLGDLCYQYPSQFARYETQSGYDPWTACTKVEYWSNDRPGQKGKYAVMATVGPTQNTGIYAFGNTTGLLGIPEWLVKPTEHGYSPESLPIVGVPVNGLNLTYKPQIGELLTNRLAERQALLGAPNASQWWSGQNNHVAESGRSILAAVEEHVPQYNELIATIMHHLAVSAYGTWVFTSPTGEQPRFTPGIEAKIALSAAEKLDRVEIGPINADAMRLVQILGDEKQNGMLANILRANSPFQGTGVLFQQMASAALNALEPYQDGMEQFGQRIATSFLAQMQQASSILDKFEVLAPRSAGTSKSQSLFVVEFDPKELGEQDKRLRPRPVFKPSLPDDLAVRINAARLALDPRRPILSLTTVLEHILQIEDPTDELDRIWEDIANTDPVIVFEQIAQALQRMGEHDLAERIQEKQFRAAFIEELQFKQQSGQDIPVPQLNPETGQIEPLGGGGGGAMPMMRPENGGGQFNTQTRENLGGGGMGGAPNAPSMGSMGARNTV